MVLKTHVRTCELRSHEKKDKNDIPNPLDIKVAGPYLWLQFFKNQFFYGPKGTNPDL